MLAETVIYRDARGVDHAAIVTQVWSEEHQGSPQRDCVNLQVFGYLREGANPTSVQRGSGRLNFRDKGVEAEPEPAAVETALEPAPEPTVEPEPATSDAEPTAQE